jgi:hypothetical protein
VVGVVGVVVVVDGGGVVSVVVVVAGVVVVGVPAADANWAIVTATAPVARAIRSVLNPAPR